MCLLYIYIVHTVLCRVCGLSVSQDRNCGYSVGVYVALFSQSGLEHKD